MKTLGCREIKHFCPGSPLPSFVAESLAYLFHPQLQHITLGLSDGPCILYSRVCEFPHLDAFHSHPPYALVKASLAGKTSEITFLGNPFPFSLLESITPHSPWQFAHFIWLIYSCICLCDYIVLYLSNYLSSLPTLVSDMQYTDLYWVNSELEWNSELD